MTVWEALGYAGNGCYFARFFVQWLASERAGRSVTPRVFWKLSLLGTLLFGTYTLVRGEYVLLVGLAVNAGLYLRNLRLDRSARLGPRESLWIAAMLLVLVVLASAWTRRSDAELPSAWLWVVTLGQIVWGTRFLVQWWSSEREGRSHLPPAFWYVSLVGNLLLLAYALYRGDMVFILGFLPGPFLQARNIVLLRRSRLGPGGINAREGRNRG